MMKIKIIDSKKEIIEKINDFVNNNSLNLIKVFNAFKQVKEGKDNGYSASNKYPFIVIEYNMFLDVAIDYESNALILSDGGICELYIYFNIQFDKEYLKFVVNNEKKLKELQTLPFYIYKYFPELIDLIYEKLKEKLMKEIRLLDVFEIKEK